MITVYNKQKQSLPMAVGYLPTISVALPFQPRAEAKAIIEKRLQQSVSLAEQELRKLYADYIMAPALHRLHEIFSNLNYNTDRKSVVIVVSPYKENVSYLNIVVTPKVAIDKPISFKDLVQAKEDKPHYLALNLSPLQADLYLGHGDSMTLLVSNKSYATEDKEHKIRIGNETNALRTFLQGVDANLTIIRKVYDMPVFIISDDAVRSVFTAISKEENVIAYLSSITTPSLAKLQLLLIPYIANWQKIKEQNLVHKIDKAYAIGKLAMGIDAVQQATNEKKGKLLIVEKGFIYPAFIDKATSGIIYKDVSFPQMYNCRDAVEDVIEKVLAEGGKVEIVNKNILKDNLRIVLIQH